MERVCEPELMDERQQAEAYAAADFAEGDHSVLRRVDALLGSRGRGDGSGLHFVDLGCGPGNITFLLARRWPEASVLGVDGAAAMLAIAERRRRADADACRRVRFRRVVLPCPELEEPCDVLVSNSLLHHMHEPEAFWGSVKQLAPPQGWIYVRDLRRPGSPEAVAALVQRHAAGEPAVLRRDFAASLRASFTAAEVLQQLRAAGLEGLEVREVEDRHLEVQGRRP